MRTGSVKKYVIPNIPYLFVLWACLKLGTAYRLAAGADFPHKLMGLGQTVGPAFANLAPGLDPFDWLVGIVGAVGFRLLIYFKNKNAKKFRRDEEFGSARWGGPKDIAPFVDPVFENNVILTGTELLTMNTRPKNPANARNLNACVIGSSGSGKTRFWLTPQLLQASAKKKGGCSFVVVDPKGGVLSQVGAFLQRRGYRIKVFNSIDFSQSMHYNPLAYIRNEADILKFVDTLIANTKGEGKEGDPFWTKAETLLYCALIAYIIFEGPAEDRNMNTLVDMISGMEVKEDNENFMNAVDYMFKGLEKRKPDCFAVKQYRKYKLASGAEIPSIVIGVKDETTGKVETSKSIKLGDGTLTLETAVFDSAIDLKDYTCTVASDKETVATAELKDGKIVVTPVSTGTATITATYAKDNGAAEGVALLDEGEATAEDTLTAKFTVEVYKESSGGGGGGSSSSTTYAVSVEDSKNGSVSVSPKRAEKGDTVTITVKPDTGYELDELTVTDKNGDKIKLTEKDDNKFTFKMPGSKVTVETSFKLIETEPENPFTDISKSDYFYDAVLWAADKGITSGVTETLFAPNSSCTRAQMVTFLWRANGSPVVDYAMNFTDVPADAYYADAVRWAVSKGITSGTSATTFAPDMTVTRAQTVTFLYRAAGTPAVTGGSFADVNANAYYADAVAWAVAEGITSGTSATTFSPDAACTRAQIVTFLYRAQ